MNEIKLLQQYSKALQLQNQAKDKERIMLYQKIDELTRENRRSQTEIQHLKTINQTSYLSSLIREREQNIHTLHQNIFYLEQQLNNSMNLLQEKDVNLKKNIHQREKDEEKIIELEKCIIEQKENENKIKKQMNEILQQNKILKHHCSVIAKQLQQQQRMQHEQNIINQIKQNYERVIKKMTKQHEMQNEYLQKKNKSMMEEIEQLKKIVDAKDNQLRMFRRSRKKNQNERDQYQLEKIYNCDRSSASGSRSGSGSEGRKSEMEDLTMNMDLIKQNNKLIERVTELEKQKNLFYLQTFQKNWRTMGKRSYHEGPSISPLRNVNSNSNILNQNNSASKLRMRIESLKQENEELLESLRV